MPVAATMSLIRHIADAIYRNLSELIRTSATYLGIAVLVAVVMVVGMPVLRMQVVQMHRSVIVALAPDAAEFNDPMAMPSEGAQVAMVQLDSIPGDRLPPSPIAPENGPERPYRPAATANANRYQPRISADQASSGLAEVGTSHKELAGLTSSQLDALTKYISRKYLVSEDAALLFVDTAYGAGHDYKVDPLLLLAVMATESRFNPYAGGLRGGATGLMQIAASVHREKINRFGKGESGVFHPVVNTRIGAYILSDCIARRGSVSLGLACYCGAADPSKDNGYTDKVQSERRRMALAASLPVKD